MTELGCSSSSDPGLKASTAALAVSSFKVGSANFGGSGVGSWSSLSIPVSSMSVVSVPLDDGAIGEGSAMSLGLEARGEDAVGG